MVPLVCLGLRVSEVPEDSKAMWGSLVEMGMMVLRGDGVKRVLLGLLDHLVTRFTHKSTFSEITALFFFRVQVEFLANPGLMVPKALLVLMGTQVPSERTAALDSGYVHNMYTMCDSMQVLMQGPLGRDGEPGTVGTPVSYHSKSTCDSLPLPV